MTSKITFTKKQKIAIKILLANKYKEVLFDGGSRSGKTFLILFYIIMMCIRYDGIRAMVGRLRFSHAKASLWLQSLKPMLKLYFSGIYDINESDYIVRIGNSEIWLGGLDDKDRTDKILGQEYAIVFLNEGIRIALATVEKVKTRLSQKIDGFTDLLIMDCNPSSPSHYLYKRFILNSDNLRSRLHWLPDDNRVNLADDYIETMLDTLSGESKDRFRFGEWVKVPGAVYKNITEKNVIECNQDIYAYDGVSVGIDFGLYTAIDLWGFKEGKAFCIWESILLGSGNTTTKSIIAELDKMPMIRETGTVLYCDHEPDRIQELCDAGYYAVPAPKEVGAGDDSINDSELYFDTHCDNTFQCMLNLLNQQDKDGNYIEKHIKVNDHEADASRYAIHGYKNDNKCNEMVVLNVMP